MTNKALHDALISIVPDQAGKWVVSVTAVDGLVFFTQLGFGTYHSAVTYAASSYVEDILTPGDTVTIYQT